MYTKAFMGNENLLFMISNRDSYKFIIKQNYLTFSSRLHKLHKKKKFDLN